MFKGFNIKKIITWILSAILIYFVLIVIFQIISYANKSSVEKALGAYLKTGSFKIRRHFQSAVYFDTFIRYPFRFHRLFDRR